MYKIFNLVLTSIMRITRFDTFFRKIIPSYFDNFFEIILEIFTKIDIKTNNYILIIIFNLLKELALCDKYGNQVYQSIIHYLLSIDIILYRDPLKDKKKEQKISNEIVRILI